MDIFPSHEFDKLIQVELILRGSRQPAEYFGLIQINIIAILGNDCLEFLCPDFPLFSEPVEIFS